ncbi:hypothetical protein TSAR_008802 [Trichomalopsis sarcophagae]|uniref:Uncharacterized protein n=1 Tax=Trichomalopsis sarcophagae TaxID=543379 RepID=A0A232F813_9HYME|nr:hypothetical protein TSAR_008802 [Trichomalopsis sarcophagae]
MHQLQLSHDSKETASLYTFLQSDEPNAAKHSALRHRSLTLSWQSDVVRASALSMSIMLSLYLFILYNKADLLPKASARSFESLVESVEYNSFKTHGVKFTSMRQSVKLAINKVIIQSKTTTTIILTYYSTSFCIYWQYEPWLNKAYDTLS